MAFASLPTEQKLEVCKYLDAKGLGALECCGRHSCGESDRAWSRSVEHIPRGALAALSAKRFAAACSRTRALMPASMDEARLELKRQSGRCFDGLAISFAVQWEDADGTFRSALFEHMTCQMPGDLPEDHVFKGAAHTTEYFLEPPGDATGHALLTPELSLLTQHPPYRCGGEFLVSLYCTRIRDGAAIQFGNFDASCGMTLDDPDFGGVDGMSRLSFELGDPLLDFGYDDALMSIDLYFEKSSGVLRACIYSFSDGQANSYASETIEALIYSRFEKPGLDFRRAISHAAAAQAILAQREEAAQRAAAEALSSDDES